MSSTTPETKAPAAEAKAPAVNRVGLSVKEYGGSKSTLCVGCGHDVITRQITQALYEMSIPPYKVAKLSGIGCSSKTTAYFADRGHGFNAVHGRMPAVATGAFALVLWAGRASMDSQEIRWPKSQRATAVAAK